MKIYILILILIYSLQSWTKADDIRDFEIEGISIGDSLLDYFSKNEIINNIEKDYYKHNKFQTAEFYKSEKFKKYDSISFSFKKKDTN